MVTTMANFLDIEIGKKSNHGISNMLVAGWLNIFIAEPILLIPSSSFVIPYFSLSSYSHTDKISRSGSMKIKQDVKYSFLLSKNIFEKDFTKFSLSTTIKSTRGISLNS